MTREDSQRILATRGGSTDLRGWLRVYEAALVQQGYGEGQRAEMLRHMRDTLTDDLFAAPPADPVTALDKAADVPTAARAKAETRWATAIAATPTACRTRERTQSAGTGALSSTKL